MEVELGRVVRVMAEVDECVVQSTREPPIDVVVVVVVVVRRSMLGMSNGSKVAFQLGLGIESCGGRSGHSRRTFMSANHSNSRDGNTYIHLHPRRLPIDPTLLYFYIASTRGPAPSIPLRLDYPAVGHIDELQEIPPENPILCTTYHSIPLK